MILETKQFKQICSKIIPAIDSSNTLNITDVLELVTDNDTLNLNVTNREYYVNIKFKLNTPEQFHATVNADLFLKLISQITTDTIELKLDNTAVKIKGNGNYKIPLIFDNDNLMELPKIKIDNVTLNTVMNKSILDSIVNYNSKEMIKENITRPIQKMYYLDNEGCITFTGTGACVNNFSLPTPFKILLNTKIVKLFKLFKTDTINFKLGYDEFNNVIQTKVCFYDDEIELTSILSCDDTLLNSVPVNAIRSKLNFDYPYSIVLDKNILNQSLSRLVLFNKADSFNYYKFAFNLDTLIISDEFEVNKEEIKYENGSSINQLYETYLNISELKLILDGCSNQYINILFGNNKTLIMVRDNIKNIFMEYSKTNG